MSQAPIGERTWIDAQADRFEREWNEGGDDRPRIEDYLAGQSGSARGRLLSELLRMERELRKSVGEEPVIDEYHARFPGDGAVVDAAFGAQRQHAKVPSKPPPSAAQSLLLGLLALQNNFIDRETLLAAFNAWVADKSCSLGQILVDRGALSPARHALLLELVQEHLDKHSHDPERSLAVLTVVPAVRDGLELVPDLELHASLLCVGMTGTDGGSDDEERTASWYEETGPADAEGRFQIVRLHDHGALGEVYLARDQQLHRIVALKRIKLDHASDLDKRARFVVEAEITGRLEHPGIVPVYGLGTDDDGRPFYAMRFVRGDNLRSAIEQFHQNETKVRAPGERNLALQKLLRRFLDVCNAIDYAHSRGVLHRDLKPGNIMLGKFGETLVVDWGLAKSQGQSDAGAGAATLDERTLVPQSGSDLRGTEFGARLGTPAYMSPEQAGGRVGELSPASDVYSLGATLYCLLTGRAPFDDRDLPDLLHKVERGEFAGPRKLKAWIDPALEAICLKAMAREPARRYPSPRALADDVEHWLADEPVSAWREPIVRRLRRWSRRHRLLMTAAAATVLVAAGALAVGNVLVARQRDRAEKNLAFARRVVDEMYTGVAEKLEDQREMDGWQREILEKALKFYEHFALPQSRDPQVRLEAARTGMRVGELRSRLGDTAGAEQADRQAVNALMGLVSDRPAESLYRDALAEAHQRLGRDLYNEGRCLEAEQEHKVAIWAWEALARARPKVARYRSKLADAHVSLAGVLRDQGRTEESAAEYRCGVEALEWLSRENPVVIAYEESLARGLRAWGLLRHDTSGHRDGAVELGRALAIDEKLSRIHPEVTRYQLGLVFDLEYLGTWLAEAGRIPEAEEAHKRAIRILERLAADHPQDTQIATHLGAECQEMEDCALLKGDFRSGLDWAGRAIQVLRSLWRADPRQVRQVRWNLVRSLEGRAEILIRLGRNADALRDYDEILELTRDNRQGELIRAFHALTKARLGDLSTLARIDNEIRETLNLGSSAKTVSFLYGYYMTNYDAACLHAALAKLALKDPRRSAAEPQRSVQQDFDRALELLLKSHAAGEFKKMIRLDEIRRETLLDPLRSNPRFQLLMMDLVFPDRSFGP